jgi:glycosyltransferase involved in cell wall biosynthesis
VVVAAPSAGLRLVEVANFPFTSVLAVRAALGGPAVRIVGDWFEIWSATFWRNTRGRRNRGNLRRRWSRSHGRWSFGLVLSAGRRIFDKGVDLLPETFAAVHRLIHDIRFVIAGDGPLRLA